MTFFEARNPTVSDTVKKGGVSPFPYSYDPKNPRFILPANLFAIDNQFVWQYTYQMNFSVQRQIAKEWIVTGAYVGTLARRLPGLKLAVSPDELKFKEADIYGMKELPVSW